MGDNWDRKSFWGARYLFLKLFESFCLRIWKKNFPIQKITKCINASFVSACWLKLTRDRYFSFPYQIFIVIKFICSHNVICCWIYGKNTEFMEREFTLFLIPKQSQTQYFFFVRFVIYKNIFYSVQCTCLHISF